MISEQLIQEIAAGEGEHLAKAARRFPRFRKEQPVNPATLFRWVTDGVRLEDGTKVYLEAARNAGKLITSPAAIQRFLAAQNPDTSDTSKTAPTRPPTRRQKAAERAGRELAKLGVK